MIRLSKINDKEVKPIKVNNLDTDPRKFKGHKLFTNNLANIYLVSKKKSGKTNIIYNILKNCAGKDTNILVFSSTCDKDSNYISMKKYFKKKGIPFVCNTSIFSEDGTNTLKEFLDTVKVINKEEEDSESEDEETKEDKYNLKLQVSMFGKGIKDLGEEEEEPTKRKSKYKYPENIIVFDDISNELKNPIVERLMKSNRHYNCMVILSSQYANDLSPAQRKQVDYCIMFRGHREDKLQLLYNDFDLSIEFPTFLKLYKHATEKPFNFLYCDIRTDEFRKNFNYKYIIPDDK